MSQTLTTSTTPSTKRPQHGDSQLALGLNPSSAPALWVNLSNLTFLSSSFLTYKMETPTQ